MNIKRDINALRRKLMRSLTKNIGTSHFDPNTDFTKVTIKKIREGDAASGINFKLQYLKSSHVIEK